MSGRHFLRGTFTSFAEVFWVKNTSIIVSVLEGFLLLSNSFILGLGVLFSVFFFFFYQRGTDLKRGERV